MSHLVGNARAPTEWERTLGALQRDDTFTTVNFHCDDRRAPHQNNRSSGINLELSSSVITMTLQVPRPSLGSTTPITTEEYARLLDTHVATSAALRTIRLLAPEWNTLIPTGISVLAEQMMRAARRNHNVCALELSYGVSYDPLQMVEFLDQTTSLQQLQLDVSRRILSDESRLIVMQALARNTQITNLFLKFNADDGVQIVSQSLQTLHQNTALQKLCVALWGTTLTIPGHVWTLLLRSGIPLRSLALWDISFDRDAAKGLMDGLIARKTDIDLELNACFFDHEAIDEVILSIPTMRKNMVSTLTIRHQCYRRNCPRMNNMIEKIYPLSPFKHLAIDLSGDFTRALLSQLTIKSPPLMESLTLLGTDCEHADMEALAIFIKSAIHLKTLSVELSEQNKNFRTTLEKALRENGSVETVSMGLTRTYCDRNANLRLLLQQQPMPPANLSLVPSLFQAAKSAKNMVANIIFTTVSKGFVHLDNQQQGQLRMRSALD
jgi:hypothetical protein